MRRLRLILAIICPLLLVSCDGAAEKKEIAVRGPSRDFRGVDIDRDRDQ